MKFPRRRIFALLKISERRADLQVLLAIGLSMIGGIGPVDDVIIKCCAHGPSVLR